MRKLLLVAFIATAGILSAKNDEKKNLKVKKDEKREISKIKAQTCYTYGMMAWCRPNEIITDTVCYDNQVPGSYEHSMECQRENVQLYNIFMCKTADYLGPTQTIY